MNCPCVQKSGTIRAWNSLATLSITHKTACPTSAFWKIARCCAWSLRAFFSNAATRYTRRAFQSLPGNAASHSDTARRRRIAHSHRTGYRPCRTGARAGGQDLAGLEYPHRRGAVFGGQGEGAVPACLWGGYFLRRPARPLRLRQSACGHRSCAPRRG